VRLLVVGGIAGRDLDVEIGADLVDETDIVPGELAARTFQRPQMRIDEFGPLGGETGVREFRT
jgi:hypothetical protein